MNVGGEVTTVVGEVDTPDTLLFGPAPPGEDENASNGDGRGGMGLSGEDVLRRGSGPRLPTNGHVKGKRTQGDQAPRAVRVSMGTAV